MSNALSRIHIEGFKSLENVDLEPGRVTVLIGPNGAGKSNLLRFLQMVPLIQTRSLRRIVGEWGGSSALLFYGPTATPQLSFRLEFEQSPFVNSYSVRLGHASRDTFVFLEEEVGRRGESDSEFETFDLR
jgi:predicted ATPase